LYSGVCVALAAQHCVLLMNLPASAFSVKLKTISRGRITGRISSRLDLLGITIDAGPGMHH
jgi:hypothetical protein